MTDEPGPLVLYTQEELNAAALEAASTAIEYAMAHIDLNDARTANSVADAIVRFRGGGFVLLDERYPWIRDANAAKQWDEHGELLRALLADPLQHEHLIDVQDSGIWTLRHPLEERIADSLFECKVADQVHNLGIEAMPDSGVYVVKPGESHVDFLIAP